MPDLSKLGKVGRVVAQHMGARRQAGENLKVGRRSTEFSKFKSQMIHTVTG
jgi:hypothetical protein